MKNIAIFFIIGGLLTLCNVSTHAQDKAVNIDSIMQYCYDNNLFNGSVLVAHKSKVLFTDGYGYSDTGLKKQNNPETIFRLGSVTKTFTSILIMKLYEEGKLELDDKVTSFIPDYPKEQGDKISIRHLLSHSSGMTDYTSMPGILDYILEEQNPEEFIKFFWNEKTGFEPGSEYNYSNSGYFLLGAITEVITGKKYAEALQEYIFNPLGMKNSGYINDDEHYENEANGYVKTEEGLSSPMSFHHSLPFAAGGIYSTAEDLYIYFMAIHKNEILSPANTVLLQTPCFPDADDKYGYGFGILQVDKGFFSEPVLITGHEGQIPGFRSLFHIVNNEYLIVLLDNNENSTLFRISASIIRILIDGELEYPSMGN